MDNSTRRFNGPDEPDEPDDSGAPTRRLDRPAPDLSDEDAGPPCIRCDTAMLATTAYSAGPYSSQFRLFMRGAKSTLRKSAPTTVLDAMTCPNCGYTELRVRNLEEFAAMIEAQERDPRMN
jgi:hypothetical protein